MSALPTVGLRIGVVQAESLPGAVAANVRRAAGWVAEAAGRGARLVVLPELYVCGYDLPGLTADPRGELVADEAGGVQDGRLVPLTEAAVRSGVTVVLGAAVRRLGGALTNSALVVTPEGAVSVGYDKQHLWHSDEARLFVAGSGGGVVEVDGWSVGLAVCYDMSFPEHARAAALAGAHVYLCPSAFAAGGEYRADVYMAARALENTVYSVFANPVGGPADRLTAGGSVVYGPDGRAVASAGGAGEQLLLADLDPVKIGKVRELLRMLSEV